MSHVELGTSIISRLVMEGKAPDMPSLQSKNHFFPCKNHKKIQMPCYVDICILHCLIQQISGKKTAWPHHLSQHDCVNFSYHDPKNSNFHRPVFISSNFNNIIPNDLWLKTKKVLCLKLKVTPALG